MLGARYLALSGVVFVLPFLLFAGFAGQLADRFSKTRVLQITKAFEIPIMCLGMVALAAHSIPLLLVVLFFLAAQANFFSPAKYGILPEMLEEGQISRANGLLELSTFAAIVLGTSVGSFLFAHWKNQPYTLGAVLLGLAMVGSLTSLFIRKVPACGSTEAFSWNPFKEVLAGTKRLRADRSMGLTVTGISYFWFVGALFQMTIILLGTETLHLSDMHNGLLVTALAVGIGLGSMAAGWISGDRIELGLVPVGAALLGACAIMVGSSHSVIAIGAWLAAVGFSGGLFIVPLNAYLQERAGTNEKGRLLATNNFMNMIGVIAASGALALMHDVLHFHPATILIVLGAVTLVSTIYIAWLMPAALVRFFTWTSINIFFKVRIVGAENLPKTGGALLVSNHVTYADAALIGCATDREIRFLMWQALYEKPWLRPFCKLFNTIPLPTGAPKESLRALVSARQEIENGSLVAIFPEGELTRTGHVKPFERGVELLLRGAEPKPPVIPIYLEGLWGHALSKKCGRLKLRRPVTISIGEPIYREVTAESLLSPGAWSSVARLPSKAKIAPRFRRDSSKLRNATGPLSRLLIPPASS